MYDVIVAGARCAGAPLAMLLARKGYKVLLADKFHFPSDTISTHLIWHSGLARAKRWGLLERIAGLGAPPIRVCRLDVGDFEFEGSPPPVDEIDFAVAPRRTVLDKLLIDAAVEAGAELREGFYVAGVVQEGNRVTGIHGRVSGREVVERARMVVGADGTHSLIASAVGAPKYNERPSTATAYYSYWRGGPRISSFDTFVRADAAGAALPTNDGLTCIIAGYRDTGAHPQENHRKFMESVPRLREFRLTAEEAEPLTGMRDLPGFFRKPWGDGWALAGDAGYHKHPLSAQGITDAFRDADLLSEAIDDGLSGRRETEDALADYERQRNEAVLPIFESTIMRARLEPFPPEMMALFRALRVNRREADRFFGTDAGSVPVDEFFSPENLGRIIQTTPASGAAGA